MGRKADAHTIVPMCDGHHRLLHAWGVETFSRSYAIDLAECAAHTERRWQSHLAHAGLEHISSIVPRVVAAVERKESA